MGIKAYINESNHTDMNNYYGQLRIIEKTAVYRSARLFPRRYDE